MYIYLDEKLEYMDFFNIRLNFLEETKLKSESYYSNKNAPGLCFLYQTIVAGNLIALYLEKPS